MTATASPSTTTASGPTARGAFSTVITWVFALLPANFVPQIIAALVGEYGIPVEIAGYIASGMTLANAAAVLSVRAVVERGHRVLVARIGITILVASFAAMALWPSATLTMTMLIVAGLGSGATVGAATASVSATRNPDGTTQIGIITNRLILGVAFLVLPLIGGGITPIFAGLAVIGVLAFLGAHFLPAPPAAAHDLPSDELPDPVGSRRVAWMLAIGFALFTITDEGIYAVLQLLMTFNLPTLDEASAYLIFAIGVFAGLAGALVSPLLLRFVGRVPSVAVLLALSILAKLGLVLIVDTGWYIAASTVWGFCFGALIPLVFGFAAGIARSGSASVLTNGVYVVGVALGPVVSTNLLGIGGTGLAIVMTVVAVVAAALVVVALVTGRPLIREARELVQA